MRFTAVLTSRVLRRPRPGLLTLGTALRVRLVYGATALIIMTAAVIAGDFPADLTGTRLPGTLLIFALAAVAIWKALAERRLDIDITDSEGTVAAGAGEIREVLAVAGIGVTSRLIGRTSDCRALRLMTIPLGSGRRPDGRPRRSLSKLSLIGRGFDYFIEESGWGDGLLYKAAEIGSALGIPVEKVLD